MFKALFLLSRNSPAVPDLTHVLQTLGEKLSPEETQVVLILLNIEL